MTSEEMADMTPAELLAHAKRLLEESRRATDMAQVKLMAQLNHMG